MAATCTWIGRTLGRRLRFLRRNKEERLLTTEDTKDHRVKYCLILGPVPADSLVLCGDCVGGQVHAYALRQPKGFCVRPESGMFTARMASTATPASAPLPFRLTARRAWCGGRPTRSADLRRPLRQLISLPR